MSGGRSRSTTRSRATGPTSCSRISGTRSCGWRWRCCAPRCGAPATTCTASRSATPTAEPRRAGGGRARSAGDHRRERPPAARAADLRRGCGWTGERPERLGVQETEAALALAHDTPVPAVAARPADPAAAGERRRAAGGAAGARRRPRPPADRDAGRPRPRGAGARRGDPQRAGGNDPPRSARRARRSAAADHRP